MILMTKYWWARHLVRFEPTALSEVRQKSCGRSRLHTAMVCRLFVHPVSTTPREVAVEGSVFGRVVPRLSYLNLRIIS